MKGAGALQCLTQLSHSTAGAHTQTREVLQFRHRKGNPILSSDFSHFPTCLSFGVVLVLCSTQGPRLEAPTSPELSTASDFPTTPTRFTTATPTVPATQTTSSLLPKACLFCTCSSESVAVSLQNPYFLFCFSQVSKLHAPHKEQDGSPPHQQTQPLKDDLHPGLGRAVLRPLSVKGGFHTPHSLSFNDELHPGAPQAAYKAGAHSHHGSCY